MAQLPMSGRVHYGGDYNPEQWPPEVWEEDVKLMREAGVDLVTVGVFSWAQLEPEEGSYSFGWLHSLLDLLAGAEIGVDLATPTAAPPAWLSVRYPDVLPVDPRGARYSHGSRQTICVCSSAYREKATGIATRLAAEVGQHEALRMWHVHNEYGCEVPYCYCDNHALAFRRWLAGRYRTLDALNEAWGTAFWSQRYTDFQQVVPPRMTGSLVNPGLDLDYRRFNSDAFLEAFLEQRAILKKARPDLPVTTNFMGFFKPVDYFDWAAHLDVVSTDNYPDPEAPDWAMQSAMHYDLVRGLNKAVPWMVMEQTSSRVNWRVHNVPKPPGGMRASSYQAIARGASAVLFFQWRASRAGAEKFHSAMVPHSGVESPVWAEVAALGKELEALESLDGLPVEAKVAVIFSWPNWWALEAPSKPANDLFVGDQLSWVYRPLYEAGATVDFCRPDEALTQYEAVIVPSLYLMSEAEGTNLISYVEKGGTAVISFWSGVVDEHDRVHTGPYGGPLRPLIGCDVLEVAPLPAGQSLEVDWADGPRSSGSFWLDITAERRGRVLARVSAGPWAGRPAVVETSYGQGRAYYITTRLSPAGMAHLYSLVPALRGEPTVRRAGPGVERVVRSGGGQSYEFLINHSSEPRDIEVAAGGLDLLTGSEVGPRARLAPAGAAIIRRPRPGQTG